MEHRNKLTTIEVLQAILLGLVLSISLLGFALYYLLIESIAYFPGFFGMIIFHDREAYWVSALWIGLAILVFSRYFVKIKFWQFDAFILDIIGMLLVMLSLISTTWFTFIS